MIRPSKKQADVLTFLTEHHPVNWWSENHHMAYWFTDPELDRRIEVKYRTADSLLRHSWIMFHPHHVEITNEGRQALPFRRK